MKIKHFAISSFIFLAFQILHLSVVDPAQAFTCPEGGFSIWMPGAPTLKQVNHKSFAGNVKENSYTLNTGTEKYSSSYTVLPGIAFSFLGDNALLNKAKKSFLKAIGAQELSFQKFLFEGKMARELVFQIPSENDAKPTSGKARFYLFGKKLYVVTIAVNKSLEGNALIDRYLNSFKLHATEGKDYSLTSFHNK